MTWIGYRDIPELKLKLTDKHFLVLNDYKTALLCLTKCKHKSPKNIFVVVGLTCHSKLSITVREFARDTT